MVLRETRFFNLFIYFIFSLHCSERGLLFVAVCGLLIAVASLVVQHGL